MNPFARCSRVPVIPPVSRFPRCASPRKAVITVNGKSPDADGNVTVGDVRHDEFSGVERKDGMTLNEVGRKTNEVVGILKGAVAALVAALAVPALSALSPDTQFGDVPPETPVRDMVEAGGAGANGVRAIVDASFPGGTNAVNAVVSAFRPVDGAARPLQKYLHALDFADSYPDEAQEYYRSRGNGKADGGCSAVRDGGFVYRNFDFPFDERAEFVVRMGAGEGRFASVGVAQVGTNLTEDIVTSGLPEFSRRYKWLPGATVDGVNENGVVCEINVVDGNPHENGWPSEGAVHCLGAVRRVLDSATTARSAASDLVDHLFFPAGFSQNFHWMIADERETWIVENGSASNVTAVAAKRVMTNFPILPDTYSGMGKERYQLLHGGEPITNAWFTRAYSPSTDWFTDFGNSAAIMEGAKSFWNDGRTKEQHRGETVYGEPWWQTVHTSVYDITNLTLRICVQESGDWYSFAVAQGGKVKSVNGKTGEVALSAADVHALPDTYTPPVQPTNTNDVREIVTPMLVNATNDLRRVDDLAVRELVFTPWSYELPEGASIDGQLTYSDYWGSSAWFASGTYDGRRVTWIYPSNDERATEAFLFRMGEGDEPVVHATRSETIAAVDSLATTNGVRAVETNLTAKMDLKRDLTDNIAAADSFTAWVAYNVPESVTLFDDQPTFDDSDMVWKWDAIISEEGVRMIGSDDEDATESVFSRAGYSFTATRQRVAVSGETFVTQSFVTNGVRAVETNLTAKLDLKLDKPTIDNPTVTIDTPGGAVLDVGTGLNDAGGVVNVGNDIGGIIRVGTANSPNDSTRIYVRGKEVVTEDKLDAKRDLTNNVCMADSLAPWTFDVSRPGLMVDRLEFNHTYGQWMLIFINGTPMFKPGAVDDTEVHFSGPSVTVDCYRSKLAVRNETFVTQSFVTNEMAAAIASDNPVFASAVRDAEGDPVLADFKAGVWEDVSPYFARTNMTQREKTELLLKVVSRFRPEEED